MQTNTKLTLHSIIELDVTNGLTDEAIHMALATLAQAMRDGMEYKECETDSGSATEMVKCKCYRNTYKGETTFDHDTANVLLKRIHQ